MSQSEPKRRVHFTPRDSDRAELKAIVAAFGGSENGVAREAFEAGLSLVKAKKLNAAKALARTKSV